MRLCVAGIVLTASSCAITPAKSPKAAQAPVPEAAKPAPSSDPKTPPATSSVPSFPARLEPQTDAEKKLDGSLLRIARAAKSGGMEQGEAAAKALDLLSDDRKIKIEITMNDKAQVAAIRDAVVARGGSIVVSLENHIFVMISPGAIAELAARPDVFSMASVAASIRQ